MRLLIAPHLRAVHSSVLHVVGGDSYALRARPEDDGAMWPALAVRCRRALPARLSWAAALLDPERPLARHLRRAARCASSSTGSRACRTPSASRSAASARDAPQHDTPA